MAGNYPVFHIYVDWDNNGDFSGPNEEITNDFLGVRGNVSVSFGRDQQRALSPAKPGTFSFLVNNSSKKYSPDSSTGPLFGKLVPGRPVYATVTQDDTTYALYRGYIDEFTLSPNPDDLSVTFSCLDSLALLAQANISTQLYSSVRTGTAIGYILDAIGWPAVARDLDPGATIMPWWWEEGTDGMTALNRVLSCEGPPAIAFVASDGKFVYRDRHHRLLRTVSTTVQATFTSSIGSSDDASTAVYSPPVEYRTGWVDITNTISFELPQRAVNGAVSVVWQSDGSPISIPNATTLQISVQASDPFMNAIIPVQDIDYTIMPGGSVSITLDRTSGQSATISIQGLADSVISGLQLRANLVPVANTVQVNVQDTPSVASYKTKSPPNTIDVGFTSVEDAKAIANIYLAYYSQRRPAITIPIFNINGFRLFQMLYRDLSDRVHIVDRQTGLDDDFFIESISHFISQAGMEVLTTFGCEKAPQPASGQFRFDDATFGKFDVGKFGSFGLDSPTEVFIFDHATQGKFDVGLFGT